MREIAEIVRMVERQRGERFALATLVSSRGSSYRRPGARMLIAAGGRMVGSLSGGCLEEEVAARALAVLHTGRPELLEFDTRRRFGCNGALQIFVERASEAFLDELLACHRARRCCLIATIFAEGAEGRGSRILPVSEEAPAHAFLQEIEPPPQLIVVGDGPDSAALQSFAETLGWHALPVCNAVELRSAYDEWTAAVIKTHNYGRDFAALRALLPLGLRYVGLIGPRSRRDQLLSDLLDTGVAPGNALFGPAGLDLGGDSPEAIALAIVAEIQAVFAGGTRESLRDRKAPIHTPRLAPEAAAL